MTVSMWDAVVQTLLLLAGGPFISGLIRTAKARLQTRRGPSLLQPYRDLARLLRKGMVIPETASFIFVAAPFILFATTLLAGLLVPTVTASAPLSRFGGVLVMVYLFALGRFFLALAGLDTGSAFGGMGSSREMTIAALAEPALMLAVFTVALGAGSTDLSRMAQAAIGQGWRFLAPSQMLAFAALFIVLLAETGRIPVDNPATHLELTMIHEAMILEYSGPWLALIEWSASVKQLVLLTLLANLFIPFTLASAPGVPAILTAAALYLLKILVLVGAVVLVETTNAKMRLFRVPELLAVAFVLSALALISTFLFGAR
ncbi:MAG: respiratory chain complex I subunit 1 family protein [Bryobacteraceae bacterium]